MPALHYSSPAVAISLVLNDGQSTLLRDGNVVCAMLPRASAHQHCSGINLNLMMYRNRHVRGICIGLTAIIGCALTGAGAESPIDPPVNVVEIPAMAPPKEASQAKRVDVWVVDCLDKVWRDASKPDDATNAIVIHAARGEYEAAQIAIRPRDESIGWMRAMCSQLASRDSKAKLPPGRVRFVDYVPVEANSWRTPPEELIATAPAWIPDIIYDSQSAPVWKDRVRPIWVTFKVPQNAEPGVYTGEVTIFAGEVEIKTPVTLRVHQATVPSKRNLKVTNWVNLDAMQRWNGCQFYDDRFWKFVKIYAENMADHRQNMIIIPIFGFYSSAELIGVSAEDNDLKFDFSNFERYAQIFLDAGCSYLEGSHLGWVDETIFSWYVEDGKLARKNVPAKSPEAEKFLSRFLPALQAHLQKKGWLNIYYQHVRDEPGDAHIESYNHTRALMRKYCPGIMTIEATHSMKIEPPTIMVPLLSHFGENYEFYKSTMAKGQEVWFYTACGPNGSYANRFLDIHLLKVRYLHWLNFKYNATGFLEWGYNFWEHFSPISSIYTTWSVGPLPPGDSYVVYPTPHGVLDSIRWEVERDGIEDYELLKVLEVRDPMKARTICSSLILGFDNYVIDVAKFRAARLELLNALTN